MSANCAVCALQHHRGFHVPPSGDCRETSCADHQDGRHWIEVFKPKGVLGVESIVIPALACEVVEE